MRLTYHPKAEIELVKAALFYQRRALMLGIQFLSAADRAIEIILESPNRWRVLEDNVRQYRIPRFPYSIHYQVSPEQIQILAFRHHSRYPHYWRSRLKR